MLGVPTLHRAARSHKVIPVSKPAVYNLEMSFCLPSHKENEKYDSKKEAVEVCPLKRGALLCQ